MDAVITITQQQVALAAPSKKLLGEAAAETARVGFCPDPVLFAALRPALDKPQPQEPQLCEDPALNSMGSCYPKCMGAGEELLVLPGAQAKRSPAVAMDATLYEAEELLLLAKMRTFDLEELGLAAQSSQPKPQQEKSIVVDYEDSDGEHPEMRDEAATCAPSACGPLTGGVAAVDSSSGRLARRRSRGGSLEMDAAPATGSLRGKSVIFEQEGKSTEPTSPSTIDADAEEEERCSKVHKLCMCEVKLHRSLESCWLVSSGQVYDVTGLVTSHPGGVRSILRKAGGPDCARDMKFHTKKARKMMEKCFIGKLQQCGDDVECAGEGNCSIM